MRVALLHRPLCAANAPWGRTRLARFALIENTRTRGRENEWQLTPAGNELETAIRDDSRRVK
jgi:hypothetical protein